MSGSPCDQTAIRALSGSRKILRIVPRCLLRAMLGNPEITSSTRIRPAFDVQVVQAKPIPPCTAAVDIIVMLIIWGYSFCTAARRASSSHSTSYSMWRY